MPPPPPAPRGRSDDVMTVVVHAFDWTLPVFIGRGHQTFSWLAEVAAYHYSLHHHHLRAVARSSAALSVFSVTNVVDEDDNAYCPSQPLYQHLHDQQRLFLTFTPTFLPCSDPPSSPRTLWSLLSSSSPSAFVPLLLRFDLRQIGAFKESSSREVDPPAIATNLTGWRTAIPLRLHRASLYLLHLDVPVHSHVLFVFMVQGKAVLSPDYPTVRDQFGQELHYVHVQQQSAFDYPAVHECAFPLPPALRHPAADVGATEAATRAKGFVDRVSAAEFSSSILVTEEDEADELRVLPIALTGHFLPASPSLQSSLSYLTVSATREAATSPPLPLQLRILSTELACSVLPGCAELVDSAEKATLLSESLHRHHPLLRSLHASTSLSSGWWEEPAMTRLEWLSLMRVCRVPDKRVTVLRLERIFNLVTGAGVDDWGRVRRRAGRRAFDEECSAFHSGACMTAAGFLQGLVRVAALKSKQVASSAPHTALESLVSRHVLPFASLWHLPTGHLRADHHHRQLSSLSSQSTQDREREKERAKEKLLYAALLHPPLLRLLHARQEDVHALWLSMKPSHLAELYPASHTPTHPLWLQTASLEAFAAAMKGRRWWTAADDAVAADCWVDESMDEKQSEKEKEIEREKAAEREKDAGAAATNAPRDTASSAYAMTYAEFTIWLVKLAERWALHHTRPAKADSERAEAEHPAEEREPPSAASGEESKEQLQHLEDEERRREEEDAREKLRLKEAADDLLYHRHLYAHAQAFFEKLFPSKEEQRRLRAEDEREAAEAAAKEQSARAAAIAAEKAERAANAKKKESDAKEAKAADKAAPGKRK